MNNLILGSSSPRRKEIMEYFDLPFEQIASPFDEKIIKFTGNPVNYVLAISEGKADSLTLSFPDRLVLTADTTVYCDGKVYGKPNNPQEAFDNLSELVGKWHSVYTGVTVSKNNKKYSLAEETKVLFHQLTSDQILNYQNKLYLMDKAGGYAIQKAGGLIVRKIHGCYYNVMGLPINTVRRLLSFYDIDLWNHIR